MSIKDFKNSKINKLDDEELDIFNEDAPEDLAEVVNKGINNYGTANLGRSMGDVSKENKELKLKIKELEKQLAEKDNKYEELKCSSTNSYKELKNQLSSKNKECFKLGLNNNELIRKLEKCNAHIEELLEAKRNLEDRCITLEKDIDSLKQSNGEKENDYNNLCSELYDITIEMSNYKESHKRSNSDFHISESQHRLLESELREKIEQGSIDYDDLKKYYRELERENKELIELNNTLSNKYNDTSSIEASCEVEIDDSNNKYKVIKNYTRYLVECINERDINLKNWVARFGDSPTLRNCKPKGTADKARRYRADGLTYREIADKLKISIGVVGDYIKGANENPLELIFKFPKIKELEEMVEDQNQDQDINQHLNLQDTANMVVDNVKEFINNTLE